MSRIIRNNKDLGKYLEGVKKKYDIMSDQKLRSALNNEMERLQRYLIEEINDHYNSYEPTQYKRTGAWLESITVNPIVKTATGYSVSLTFDEGFAIHQGVTGEPAYVPWLMEVGWKNTSYETPHFEGFKGTHYIKNAVERWNRDNRFGFQIRVYHGNERYI